MKASRREFIKKAVYGILALLGLGFLVPGITLLSPVGSRDKELAFFPLCPEEEVPRAGVKRTELTVTTPGRERKIRVFIVPSPGGPTIFSATCSHLGCLVNYHKEKREFVCPCHGGRYDLTGMNIGGPPPAPLTRFPVKVLDGMLFVGIKV
jgi:Rieske Fe-S protein